MNLIDKATQYIAKKHDGQYRKGLNIPYSTHLFGVARILKTAGYGESVVIAGLLHDVFEDTNATEEEVKEIFGLEVLQLVKAVSEKDKSVEWYERKKQVIDIIAHLSEEELAVALAEKIQNLNSMEYVIETLGEPSWDFFSADKKDQQWFYESFLNETRIYHPDAILLNQMEEKVHKVFRQ